ncbi:hypothetical protein AB1Y20_011762 [Prymnesium parvum]|uniref:Uncharacterized protein n=1 Tax=Prymnesium parvum TaxID=97485 RepID=A0AB34IK20_PRYPA
MSFRSIRWCSALLLCPTLAASFLQLSPRPALVSVQRNAAVVMVDGSVSLDGIAKEDGVRKRRPPLSGWARITRAGSASPLRTAHSVFGIASVICGTTDMVEVFAHGGISTISETDIFVHFFIYTMVAALSTPRAKNRWTKGQPWKLWMPTARDSQIWITVVQYAWYTSALLSDYIRPADHALFTLDQPIFLGFSWFVTVACLYSASRSMLETGNKNSGLYDLRWVNGLYALFNVAFLMLVDVGRALLLAHSSAMVRSEWASFVAAYPEWPHVMQTAFLLPGYFMSIGWFLASAEHYGLVTKSRVGAFTTLAQGFAFVTSVAAALTIDEGRLAFGVYDVSLEAILSIVY